MIYSVRGILMSKSPFSCVLQVHGTGLSVEIKIPLSTYEAMPEVGREVLLYTHLIFSAKNNEVSLYGFLRRDERFIFKKLIEMPGVGPSLALRLLSGIKPGELIAAAERGDIKAISSIKGVGPKRAERIAFELKERMAELREIMKEEYEEVPAAQVAVSDTILSAIEALIALGLKRSEAESAVNSVVSGREDELTVEELIRKALSSRKP